jgi:type I restriction enzyme, S subunit
MTEWRIAPLREIADIRVSNVDKKSTPGEAPVRLCNYMDVYANDYIRTELPFMEATATPAEVQRFSVQHGDVLITKDSETPDDIGIPSVVMDQIESLVCGYHLAQMRPNRALVDSVYLAKQLALPATATYFAQRATGSTRYGLSNRTIAEVPIRLAPLRQQQRIAAILTSIDTAIEATEAVIEKHQQIKAGLMHDLFTRGVLSDGSLRPARQNAPDQYELTKAGWIPRDWSLTTCEAVCERIIDCKNRTPPETPDGFAVIRTPNVRHGEFVDDELLFTDARSFAIWTLRGKPVVGDVVITREAPVGEVCMIPERHPNACLGQRMMLYRPNGSLIDSRFFLFALQSKRIQNRLDLISGGSTVGHVRVGDIRNLWMFLPKSLSEQKRIADALSQASQKLTSEQVLRDKLRQQKLGLMQDLLTGKVRVPLPSPEVTA